MITFHLECVSSNNEVSTLLVTTNREEAFAAMSRIHAQARAESRAIQKIAAENLGRGVLGAWRHEIKNPGDSEPRTVVYRIRRFRGVVKG
jgi:hypothetical protein